MARARTWKLHLNLDTFNAVYAALDGPQEQSDFLTGLSRGMNAGKVKDDCPDPMAVGFSIGYEMRQDAEAFIEASSNAGKKSVEAKSNRIQHPYQHPCQGSLSQSIIHNPINQITTNQPEKKKRMSRQEKINSLDGYSPAALEVVRTLLHAWPSERPKGGKIDLDPDTACSRVMSILDRHPSLTAEMLIGAGTNYLAKMEGKGDYISALHFFFGPGKGSDMPKWETEIRAINHQRSLS